MIAVNTIFIVSKFVIHVNKYGLNPYDPQCLPVFSAFSVLRHTSCAICISPYSVLWFETFPARSFLPFVLSRMLDLRVKTLPNYSCLLPLYPPQEVSPNLSYINSCLGVWFSEDPDRSTYLIPISSGTFGLVRLIPVTGREWIWEECDQMEEFWVQGRNQNTLFCGQT